MNAFVVGTDGSHGAEAAVQKLIDLAQGSGATVHLVCAIPGRSEHRLADAGFQVEKHVREGDPAHTLIDVATENDAEMIIVGAHGTTGLKRFMLGSVSSKLSHHAPRSLMIVREE